uniref:Uncharacterized protein TCIL3000_7_2700 n=1 Tax=Trypanosoma congolense (strain IL3000) TaxID=1068625 RepID=G0UPZ5_TRYCI|nr:unnamed protein product [Trypanosoma congolense IL3000]
MLCPPEVAFEKRQYIRSDGNTVTPPSMALGAGVESGYLLKASDVEKLARQGHVTGLLTKGEFLALCNENEHIRDAYAMAKHLVAFAPDGIFTRVTLFEAAVKAGSTADTLSCEEVDILFGAMDSDNRGYVTLDEFMHALYGEEGMLAMMQIREEYMRKKIEVEGGPAVEEGDASPEDQENPDAEAQAEAGEEGLAAEAQAKAEAETHEETVGGDAEL